MRAHTSVKVFSKFSNFSAYVNYISVILYYVNEICWKVER